MIKDLLKQGRKKMEKALAVVIEDFESVQVGRARPALVEKIPVSAYEGSILTIRELANITTPDPEQILITPWDKTIIKKIAQAITDSDLRMTPIMEEDLIRLRIPPLMEERRQELKKLVEMKVEGGRRMIRQIRNDFKVAMEDLKGEAGVSEDDIFRGKEELQKLHDEYIKKIEQLGESKTKEISC